LGALEVLGSLASLALTTLTGEAEAVEAGAEEAGTGEAEAVVAVVFVVLAIV
jgi:hypothetical protein